MRQKKTITVAFQLRIPTKMSRAEVEHIVKYGLNKAISGENGGLYKDRVEMFMP